jgi:hypothetical protein
VACRFGGGDEIKNNLLTNMVRESKDHGPFNSVREKGEEIIAALFLKRLNICFFLVLVLCSGIVSLSSRPSATDLRVSSRPRAKSTTTT